MGLCSSAALLLFGCGGAVTILPHAATSISFSGVVMGGSHPISGSMVQLYTVGVQADGSASQALLSQPVASDSKGNFSISDSYTCPATTAQVYVVASGGNASLAAGASNPSIALMAALGACGELNKVPFTTINEVTTVGSVWPIAAYAKSPTQIGVGNAHAEAFESAVESIGKLVSVANGTAPGPMLSSQEVAPTAKLQTLANVIASCVESNGGTAGDGTPCGKLFSSAATQGTDAPSNTIGAALAIAQNPSRNVADIYNLSSPSGPFQPLLAASPDDWTLPVLSVPAAPSISPESATLAPGETVAIAGGSSDTAIYYTVDGSSPTASSIAYSGPFALASSETIKAIAVRSAVSSSVASKAFDVASLQVAVSPASVSLTAGKQQAFSAAVTGVSSKNVTWSISPSMGSISSAGVYTAPLSIATAGTVTVMATSVGDTTKTASASVSLVPTVGVSIAAGSVSLSSLQSHTFVASVTGTSDSRVTWSLSPAVGTISSAGVYVAPAAIASAGVVTVTATSVADTTKSASASVSLVPTVGVTLAAGLVSLSSSQSHTFVASVTGTSDSRVTWSLSPAVGTISSAGVYVAPAAIASAAVVTVTATSVADTTKTASASVSLVPTVGVSIAAGSVSLSSLQSHTFVASVTGTSDSRVMWSLSPAVGTISSGGVYVAPAAIASAGVVVTVTATSVADTTKSASASVSLVPTVGVSIAAGSVSLSSLQSHTFVASVTGTSDSRVTWSISPAMGTISSAGVYVAPAAIASAAVVTVTATSVADTTKSASSSVSLVPTVGVSIAAGSVSLSSLQSHTFVASVTGTSDPRVTWSLSPAVGTISSAGVYVAPAAIASAAVVTVTATSVADTTKTASASVSLVPTVGVSIAAGSVSLSASQSYTFVASVTGASDSRVTWSLSPAMGTISSAGVYVAPAAIASAGAVTVTATSVADTTKMASASVTLLPTPSVVATYFVDNVSGNDLNRGDSPSTAFATVGKVNSLVLTAGQTVAFRSGEEWHEMLRVSQSGTSGSPISYISYGTGSQPILSAADAVTGWTRGTSTAAQESCGSPIFCSGMETAGLGDWASHTNNGDTTVSVSAAQSNHGSSSMALTSRAGVDTRAWVTQSIAPPVVGSTLAFRWYFLAPSGSMKANSSIRVLTLGNGGTQVGFATMTTDGSGNPSTLDFYDTQHSLRILDATTLNGYLAGQWNEMEIDLAISATAGGGSLYLNGNLLSQINHADTSMDTDINTVELGNVQYGGAIAPGGSVYFDDFKTASQANVGAFNAGIPVNVWFRPQATDPKLINFGGQAGIPKNSASDLTAANQFSWNGSTLFVYDVTDPTGVVEVPQRESAVTSSGASFITFQNLEFRGAQTYDVYCGHSSASCDHWTFEGDTFNAGYSNELYFQPYADAAPSGPIVHNSLFKGGGSNGIALAGPGATGATITYNEFYDLSKIYNTAYSQNTWSDAIEGYSGDASNGQGTYIAYNNIHDIGVGVGQIYGGGIHADTINGWVIEHNTVRNTNAAGVLLEKGANSTARYNLIVNGGVLQYQAGLMIRAGDGSDVTNQTAEYNTASGGWWACDLQIQQNTGSVKATNIDMSRNICVGGASGTQFFADAGWNGSGNQFTRNNFGTAGQYWVVLEAQSIRRMPTCLLRLRIV